MMKKLEIYLILPQSPKQNGLFCDDAPTDNDAIVTILKELEQFLEYAYMEKNMYQRQYFYA